VIINAICAYKKIMRIAILLHQQNVVKWVILVQSVWVLIA